MTFNNNTGFNEAYSSNTGLTSTNPYVQIFQARDPTPHDSGYTTQKLWLNTATNRLWELKNFTSTTGQVLANWILIGSSSLTETLTGNTGGAVGPDGAQNINTIGDGVGITVAGNPATHTLTWSLVGGGTSLQKVAVDAHTAPGTNPVVPDGTGTITVTGGQVAAGTTTNAIRTDSLAANTYTVEVQRSQAVASSTVGDNGVSHYSSAYFGVDSNAFVTGVSYPTDSGTATPAATSLTVHGTGGITTSGAGSTITINGSGLFSSLNVQKITSTGTYTPTAGMLFCQVRLLGGGGGGAGCPAAGGNMAFGLSGSSGSYSEGFFTAAAIGVSQAVTIGAGGAGGAAGANDGGNGGQSSFGALMTAPGGQGGGSAAATTGGELTSNGPGAAGVGGYLNVTGNSTEGAFAVGGFATTPAGAASVFGGAGPGGRSAGSYNATGFGSGGGAPSGNTGDGAKAGGNGFAGVCIITEYIG